MKGRVTGREASKRESRPQATGRTFLGVCRSFPPVPCCRHSGDVGSVPQITWAFDYGPCYYTVSFMVLYSRRRTRSDTGLLSSKVVENTI